MDAAELTASLEAYALELCAAERVEVTWLGLDPARLPAGGKGRWEGDPCRAHPQLGLAWAVGADLDRYTVRPQLEVWVPVQVAARELAAGDPIAAMPGSAPLGRLQGDRWMQPSGLALRHLEAGEALTTANVGALPDARAGGIVMVRVRSGELEIRTEGRLLGDARIGQRVGVRLDSTGAVARGVLVAPDLVEL